MNDEAMQKGTWKKLGSSWEDALARLPDALKAEGFGILTQIDVQDTLRAKLGVETRKYRIFGACNPGFAHRALQKDVHVGVLLPCNVVLYEDEGGSVVAGAVDPMQTLGSGAPPELAAIARDVGARLERVLSTLAGA